MQRRQERERVEHSAKNASAGLSAETVRGACSGRALIVAVQVRFCGASRFKCSEHMRVISLALQETTGCQRICQQNPPKRPS